MKRQQPIRNSLITSLVLAVGLTLLVSISAWAFFSIRHQETRVMQETLEHVDQLSNTIKLGTHYAMMLDSGEDIHQIINNIGRQEEIVSIRIYDKDGIIHFSNRDAEIGRQTTIDSEACSICHAMDPPPVELALHRRTRNLKIEDHQALGLISPIYNEPGCSTDSCHVHPPEIKVLGLLDVVVSLKDTEQEIQLVENGVIGLAALLFIMTSAIIGLIIMRLVNRPIRSLIDETKRIARGERSRQIEVENSFEMEQLANAINQMGREIEEKQDELNEQRNRFRQLFEQVPCAITVQDRNYRLIEYNQEFEDTFAPKPGDFCYYAYKGRTQKCENCPVEKTFADGQTHYSEEAGFTKDGKPAHWIVRTSPLHDEEGNVIAAMEMCLDITHSRLLETQLKEAEKKYYDVFNNIPNPVFVLDGETLEILECNRSVAAVYGLAHREVLGTGFLDLFLEEDRALYTNAIRSGRVIDQARHLHKDGRTIFVTIRISLSKYKGRDVLLVTTGDITKRLEAEQQLIQASKMATLGEMASGVAHELNQPLAVIKTAGAILKKKLGRTSLAGDDTVIKVAGKIDANVDRAANIIDHMRQFARKSDTRLEPTQINQVIEKAFEMFDQQLKVRGIEVVWDKASDLPTILAEPNRLEQVFVNLFLNARDAIEEKWELHVDAEAAKKIGVATRLEGESVVAEVCDAGDGVPPEMAEKIFEPFFTTKEVGKGTGLGLSISYGIVTELGGEISVRPSPEGGACFVIRFPLKARRNGTNHTAGG
ncbi:MAG: PAS domain S-box protein [Desulfobacterales bacterium]|nr:PAS domain S-box protein [Desulfobacterales bacterium]